MKSLDSKTCPRCGGLKKVVAQDLKTVSECPTCSGAGFVLCDTIVTLISAAEIEAEIEAEMKAKSKILDKGLSNDTENVKKRKKGKAGQRD